MNAPSAMPDGNSPQTIDAVLICGLPGQRLGEAVDLVRRIFDRAFGACTVLQFNELNDDVQQQLVEVSGPLLMWADCPRPSAVEHVRKMGWPLLMVDSDFEEAAREFLRDRGASLLDTLRVLAFCRMGWWQMACLPQARHVGSGELTSAQIASTLAAWGLSSERQLDESLEPDPTAPSRAYPDTFPLEEADAQAVANFAAFYDKRGPEEARSFHIPLAVLLDGVPPHLPLSGAISLVGPARALSFGPFVYLPVGNWRLTLIFECSDNFSGNTVKFDVFVDGEAKCVSQFDITTDGRFIYSCEFFVANPWSPFEFRSHMPKGAIGGTLLFHQPMVQRI